MAGGEEGEGTLANMLICARERRQPILIPLPLFLPTHTLHTGIPPSRALFLLENPLFIAQRQVLDRHAAEFDALVLLADRYQVVQTEVPEEVALFVDRLDHKALGLEKINAPLPGKA